jgi:hypothetical protein
MCKNGLPDAEFEFVKEVWNNNLIKIETMFG